jgi:EmrB/QacA subfamily drug resistance transporter
VPELDARAKRLVLVAAILGSSIAFVDGTVVNVAVPAIADDLGTGFAGQQWIVEAYLLTLSSLLLVGGSLGDHLGRRRVFEVGVAGFGATSLLCAVAPNTAVLITGRALQGVAGALLIPGTLALIVTVFAPDERGAAIGSWTAWGGVAGVVGPFLGGLLVETTTWRLIFLINLIPVLATLWLIRHSVPKELDRREPGHIDIVGAALCALGLAGVVFALIEQSTYGFGDPRIFVPLALGVLFLILFVVQEVRSPDPMLPLSLFRERNFAVGNVATLTMYGGLGAALFFLPLYLQQVAGYSPIQAGLSLVPVTVVMFLLAKRFGALADRFGPRFFMGVGPLVAGAGLLMYMRLGRDVDYVRDVLPGSVVFAVGLSMTVAPLTAAVLASVKEFQSGVASGVNNAIARVAGLLAIAAVGAVVSSQFSATIEDELGGAVLGPSGARAVELAKARPLSGRPETPLPPRERGVVTNAIDDASIDSFRVGMGVSGALVIIGGVISLAGIVNPRRTVRCADCPGGALTGASEELARLPVVHIPRERMPQVAARQV